jgi:TM2 domain-containing membrane protein YozV
MPPSMPPPPPPPEFDPASGLPYSDKSRIAAGLLQLLPAFVMAIGGVGRLYAGHTALGAVQLVASIFAWIMLICLFWLIIPIFIFIGMWLWAVIDGVVMLVGRPVDGYGRPLRP